MHRSSIRALWAAIAVALCLVVPTAARAALPVTFDGLADGTVVQNQFASDGVVFIDSPASTGLPVVRDVGVKAASGTNVAISTCFACEFVHNVIIGQLAVSRESVSMHVGFYGGDTPFSGKVRLTALDTSRNPIGSPVEATVSSASVTTLMTINPPGTDNIAFFRLETFESDVVGAAIAIDDVTFAGTGTSPPDISISTGSTDVRLLLGGTVDVPVTIARFNGSSGNVTMSASGLPAGVTATFSPPVVGATNTTTTMHLAATVGATASFTPVNLVVTATPADALVAPAARSVTDNLTVEAPYYLTFNPAPLRVPSCGSVIGSVVVNREPGFTGTVSLAVDPPPAGYAASLGATTVPPTNGSFSTSVPLTVGFGSTGGPAGASITVHATSPGAPQADGSLAIARFPGQITGFTPTQGRTPQALQPGDDVVLTGSGFCPGATVQFNNNTAYAIATISAGDVAADGSSVHVRVPRYSTTGPITVVNADGSFSSATSFTVHSARNTRGFSFPNYVHEGVSISDLDAVYGTSQTNLTINVCWPFDCEIDSGITSPFTYLYKGISNAALKGDFSCFGISAVDQRLVEHWLSYSSFSPAGATTAWQLDGPAGPADALRAAIRQQHTTQLSSDMIRYWVEATSANLITGGSLTRAIIENDLRAGHFPMVLIRNSPSQGHALVAEDVRSSSDGGYDIDVNDPNIPFLAREDIIPGDHKTGEDNSIIHVRPDGHWTHYMGDIWSGGPGTLVAVPWGTIARTPTIPTSLTGLLSLIVPLGSGDAAADQVTNAAGKRLLGADGDLNTDPGTRIKGGALLTGLVGGTSSTPIYAVPVKGAYTETIKGTGKGTTGTGILAPGFAAQISGIATGKGTKDGVGLDARHGELDVHASTGGNLAAQLASADSSGQYGADVRVKGGDAGAHSFVLGHHGGAFAYRNGNGPAVVKVALTWGGGPNGVPGSVRLPALAVPRGGSVTIRPANWHDLGGSSVRVLVKTAKGHVVSGRTIAPKRRAHRVSALRVSVTKVRGARRTIHVSARFGRVPRGARVIIAVDVTRGRHVVTTLKVDRTRVAPGRRTFVFPVSLAAGRYGVRGSVLIVTGGTTPSAERATRALAYRAR